LLICETHNDAADCAFEGELVKGCRASGVVLNFGLGCKEGFECIGRAVDTQSQETNVDGAGETGAVGETCTTDCCPQRTFDGIEVGLSDHESGQVGMRPAIRTARGEESV
jgi:hypothetical protein